MAGDVPPVISCAVEGVVDAAVAQRLISHVGAQLGQIYGQKGKQFLLKRLNGYLQAARRAPWLVLVDLDTEADCAPLMRSRWLPENTANLCFRIAVREIESWLMADPERLASFLGVNSGAIPPYPEVVPEPKAQMVVLARASRRREIRQDMVPSQSSGRTEGPAYASRLVEFVQDEARGWRPDVASARAPSLDKCIACLRRLATASASCTPFHSVV